MASSVSTVVTSAGLQPQIPAAILAQLIANVLKTNPGYTANLPGSMIEDISSTDIAAVLLANGFQVDTVNSLTPFGANPFTLNQLGQQFGVPLGVGSNTSVFLQFTGTPGFPVQRGFVVSDGSFNYVVQDGGIIGSDRGDGLGVSGLLFAVSPTTGSWAVGSGTVQGLITAVPNTITLTVNNPSAGIPSTGPQTVEQYQVDVWQAGLASCQGQTTMMKTFLRNVVGVQQRLISVIQLPLNAGWEILVGGGDPYQVGAAIAQSGIDLASLVGSTLAMSGATQANPCVITTALNHGFATGQVIGISGVVGMTALNATTPTITVLTEKTFSLNGVNSTGYGAYVSGGVITPNLRNVNVSILDFPDTYSIIYVSPPQQSVTVTLTWNTTLPNFVSATAVAQTGAPAIAAYINSIVVGQPINVFQMQAAFVASVAGILSSTDITRMVFNVSINGVATIPIAGTEIIPGDPESYFLSTSSSITIVQG